MLDRLPIEAVTSQRLTLLSEVRRERGGEGAAGSRRETRAMAAKSVERAPRRAEV